MEPRQPKPSDPAKTRNYTENYTYDPVGNLMELGHVAQPGAFVRQFTLAGKTNRLATMTSGQTVYPYTYDAAGNMTSETLSRHFEWDHADRMRVFRNQPEPAAPTVHAQYLYDASGQRTKKLVRKQGSVEVTVYVDGHFEHHLGDVENNTLHVMDNAQRVALVRVGPPLPGDATPTVKYQLGDHLGSANVVVDAGGGFVNREEFTPYGETSFGGYARKAYRFTGKERDEESGLSYHGARYYACWRGRWMSCEPSGLSDGVNPYWYVHDSPLGLVDPNGQDPKTVIVDAFVAKGAPELASLGIGLVESALDPLGSAARMGEAAGRDMAETFHRKGFVAGWLKGQSFGNPLPQVIEEGVAMKRDEKRGDVGGVWQHGIRFAMAVAATTLLVAGAASSVRVGNGPGVRSTTTGGSTAPPGSPPPTSPSAPAPPPSPPQSLGVRRRCRGVGWGGGHALSQRGC